MVHAILLLLTTLSAQAVGTHSVPGTSGEKSECEERLEGNQAMHKLLRELVQQNPNDVVTYRIHMRAQRLTAAYLKELPEKEKWLEKFGVTFTLTEIRANAGSRLVADFELSGPVRNVVQAVMELTQFEARERVDLFPHWYSVPFGLLDPPLLDLPTDLERKLRTPIASLNLSVRSENGLKVGRPAMDIGPAIVYVGDLVQLTEADLLRIPNFGRRSLNEIKEVLGEMGLYLGMPTPGWPYDEKS